MRRYPAPSARRRAAVEGNRGTGHQRRRIGGEIGDHLAGLSLTLFADAGELTLTAAQVRALTVGDGVLEAEARVDLAQLVWQAGEADSSKVGD